MNTQKAHEIKNNNVFIIK